MRSSPVRLALIVIVFVVALAGALLLLRESKPDASRGSGADRTASSDIWKVGDTWTVQVRQDAGAVSPDSDTNIARIPFRFEVLTAPDGADGAWIVRVDQDGAEGPFAAGWRLHYEARSDEMVLVKVAIGEDKPLEAELATIVLGNQFPYETRYAAPPKDSTITAAKLIERASLPPKSMPGSEAGSGPAGAPTAPPIDEAVAPGTAPTAPKR